MSRHFKDWLEAYCTFAKDSYCPPQFHLWSGISAISGALERKVWQDRGKYYLHPNLYIMLVSHPAIGKSTAGNVANDFLHLVGNEENRISFLATQNNPASFVKQFVPYKEFSVGSQLHTQSAHYFYASEGSNALGASSGKQGTILPSLTDFYDCPPKWKKRLVGEEIPLFNVCCNMLACVTFSFLTDLLPEREAAGGFASRILFVVQDDIFVRAPKWKEPAPPAIKTQLLEDLNQIYSLAGEFDVSEEVQQQFEKWFPMQDAYRQGLVSSKMQHFLGRKHTNVAKLAMVCAVSESNELRLELRHWERAMKLIDEAEAKVPKIVKNSTDKGSAKGLSYNIMTLLAEKGQAGCLPRAALLRELSLLGVETQKAEHAVRGLTNSGQIAYEGGPGGGFRFRLLGNPEDHL